MADKKLWWDISEPLSYNCLWNFIIGMRGVGKTYGTLKYCIQQYLKGKEKGEVRQFLYVRRNKTELDKLTIARDGRLFKAVQNEFPEHELKAESNVLLCDKEVMGYATPLSTASILKSDAFPYVNTIIFDEFIIDNTGTYHYLKDEVRKFLDLYETVARMRDVRVFFLSNAVSVANPYFEYFHLDRPYNTDIQRFGKAKDILVQDAKTKEMIDAKKATRFGKLIEGSEYADYAIDNEWLLDNNNFVGKKNQRCTYYLTLLYKDNAIGVWYDTKDWRFYVSKDVDLSFDVSYSVTTDDHKPNIMLMKAAKRMPYLSTLITAYENGCVWYENLTLKSWFREIMRFNYL